MRNLFALRHNPLERVFYVTDQPKLYANVLVHFRRVGIELYDLTFLRELRNVARCSIRETNADAQNQIAFVLRHARCVVSVHTLHP